MLNSKEPSTKYIAAHHIFTIFFLVLCQSATLAIPISGSVKDSKTGEPMPFVNILVQNTTIGTMSDINGNFELNIPEQPCYLIIKFIGYKSQTINIKPEQSTLQIILEEEVQELEEIIVKPDNAFDIMMLRKVIKNRKLNNPDNIDSINYKDYARTSAFLTNLDKEKIESSKLWKESEEALVATSDSTIMVPFFIDETLTNHYRNNKANLHRTEEIAEKNNGVLSGLNDQVKSVITTKLTTEFNFHNNQINVLNRGFPSPISSSALLYYKVYVTDSITRGDRKYFKFNFYPKSYKNITFKGYFWVENKNWALTELSATLPNSANLNFVSDLSIRINYQQLQSGKWFYKEQKVNMKLAIQKEAEGKQNKKSFAVQKLNVYSEIEGTKRDERFVVRVATEPEAIDSMLVFERQTAPLDTFEQQAYEGINTLKTNPFFKFVDKFSAMTINGYYNLGKFDLGPYFAFYRKNAIEGNRFSIPIRTSPQMWDNFMLGGMLGYGLKNKELAYSADVAYEFNTAKYTTIKGHYHRDYFDLTRNKFIEFIKENPYQQGNGNVLSSFTVSVPNPYMLRNRQLSLTLEHQLNNNVGLLLRTAHNRYFANEHVLFTHNGKAQPHFDTQNITFDARFSFNQKYDQGFFSRIYYGNGKPVIHTTALLGRYNLPSSGSNTSGLYANLNFSVKNRFSIGPGHMRALVEGGGIIGNVPYPLLMMPRGSRDIGSGRYYFNLLHHASYASDVYLSTHLALNGGGTVFNKLPLIKQLNLREIVTFKAFYGKLLGNHDKVLAMPNYLRAPNKEPYMELSFGVTNIFKCLRIEYARRLNSGSSYNQFSSKHGIKMRIEVSF